MADDKKITARPPAATMGRPGHMMAGAVQKPKNFKKALRTTVRHLRPFWLAIIFVIICAIISTVFAIIGPKILGNMTTEIVKGFFSPTGINFDKIATIGWTLISIYILSAIFSYIQSWVMTRVSQNVTYSLRRDVSQKIPRLPLRFFDTHENGNIVSHITNDIETISQNLNQSLIQIITAVTTVVGILVMMLTISWQMTLIAVAVLPISLILVSFMARRSQRYYSGQQSVIGEIDGYIDEMFSNHVIVKTFNGENTAVGKFSRMNSRLFDSSWKAQFLSGLMMPVMSVISNLAYVGVAVMGGWMAINGKINIGDIQAFIQYMNAFTQPISQTANIANIFQNTIAAAERVYTFLDENEEKVETDKLEAPKHINGEVEFKDVNFSYVKDKKVIKHFDADIRSKHNVAIVGPTGAGKTTIVNLLMRFYDIDSGKITIDGIDTSQMKRQDVRRLFGMVLQDTWLFLGTVAENIAYGRPDASHEEIVEAAKAAHIDHLISTMPHGYDTIISDDIDTISAGEKQLITIARAILADAPMLILDEATSSVDTRTEALIQSAMDKLSHGRTSFVIAHRLSTIKSADAIFVMRDGDIIEKGTHQELLEKNGYYAELYNSQFTHV